MHDSKCGAVCFSDSPYCPSAVRQHPTASIKQNRDADNAVAVAVVGELAVVVRPSASGATEPPPPAPPPPPQMPGGCDLVAHRHRHRPDQLR